MARVAQILRAQAGAAGFKVEARQIASTGLVAVLRQGDFDLCMTSWSGRYDSVGNPFNHSTDDGPNNFAGHRDGAPTALLGQARSEPDRARGAELYKQARARIIEAAPMPFLHFDAVLRASSARLKWTRYPDAVFRLYDAAMG